MGDFGMRAGSGAIPQNGHRHPVGRGDACVAPTACLWASLIVCVKMNHRILMLIAALAMFSFVWTTTLLLTACISEVAVVFPDIAFGR